MTQAILLQSITEIVTIGLLLSSPSHVSPIATQSHTVREKKILAAEVHKQPVFYTVQAGQTLDDIAKDAYGHASYWTILWNDNDWLLDPAIIHAGDKLLLRNQKPSVIEELNRPLPTPTMTPTPIPTETPTPLPTMTSTSSPSSLPLDQIYINAGNKFGVPWQVLYGIHMTETGQRDGPIDSGFGPQGPMQFLPSTFAAYATDGNGDGTTDINNAADAIYTAANFLAQHGSIENGLKAYGNAGETVKKYAAARGWNP